MITGKDKRRQEAARDMLTTAARAITRIGAMPPDSCPALTSGLEAATLELILMSIEVLGPTEEQARLIKVAKPAAQEVRRMSEAHLLEKHIEEGDLASLIPDEVPEEWHR